MNRNIFIDTNSVMSKPKEAFFNQLLTMLNGENKEFPKPEELFVTMLKKTSIGKHNTEVTILNSVTNETQTLKYTRPELSERILKHTLQDKDDTGKNIRVGINSTTKKLDLDWLKGLGFTTATEEDFSLVSTNQSPNKKYKKAKFYNCYQDRDTLYYSGNPNYKSGVNGMIIDVPMLPLKSMYLEIPSTDKCTVTVLTPQLLDGKHLLKHRVTGENDDENSVDRIELSYSSRHEVIIKVEKSNGEVIDKNIVVPPSNPLRFTITIGYPRGDNLVGKRVRFVENMHPGQAKLTTTLKPLEIPKHIANILKNDKVLSNISHDFFLMKATSSGYVNLKLEERTDFKGEKFSRSFYIGARNKFNKGFYNLVAGVESDKHLFKVITKDDSLNIIHLGKPHMLPIDKTKGYGFNIDFKNKVVIFNTNHEFDNLQEMYEDLTVKHEHIKLFHLEDIDTLENPFVLMMEAEDTSRDKPPISLLYQIEGEQLLLDTDWSSEGYIANTINVIDESNPFVVDTTSVKDEVIVKPVLTKNLDVDDTLTFSVPESAEKEKVFAYQLSLPKDKTLILTNLPESENNLSLITVSSHVRDMTDLGIADISRSQLLKNKTIINTTFLLLEKQESTSTEFKLERSEDKLTIYTPNDGNFVYQVDTDETIYLGHLVFTTLNNGKTLFNQTGARYQ